ncbi:MAG: glycosyl transferase [Thermoprotei archaeon]|nr:MAG: glycosyl transferase [Thermoprotei archaeon]
MTVLSMVTKDSYTKLMKAPITLEDVLNSTLQIPYKALILVDDSKDKTREVIRRWCDKHNKELIISSSRLYGYYRPTRATARQTAIDIFMENFNDEWLMFIDDDIIINKGWWDEAQKFVSDPRIGLIWGINYDCTPERSYYLKMLGVDYIQYLIKEFYRRGGMHDTMLRRAAIKGIMIPPELHIFEDWYVLKYVQERGYRVGIVKAGITHYNPFIGYPMKDIRWMAYLAKKYGVEPKDIEYAMYRLIRSLGSIVPSLPLSIKSFGFRKGVRRAFDRWKIKVLYRVFFLLE